MNKQYFTALCAAALMSAAALASPHHHSKLYSLEELTVPVAAEGVSVDDDVAAPVVALMPFIIKKEQELKLTPQQIDALTEYRKANAPIRMALLKNIRTLRGNLRRAVLENAPQSERDALMDKIAQAELMHMQSRNRCADMVRKTLTPAQFAQLKAMYLQDLKD